MLSQVLWATLCTRNRLPQYLSISGMNGMAFRRPFSSRVARISSGERTSTASPACKLSSNTGLFDPIFYLSHFLEFAVSQHFTTWHEVSIHLDRRLQFPTKRRVCCVPVRFWKRQENRLRRPAREQSGRNTLGPNARPWFPQSVARESPSHISSPELAGSCAAHWSWRRGQEIRQWPRTIDPEFQAIALHHEMLPRSLWACRPQVARSPGTRAV